MWHIWRFEYGTPQGRGRRVLHAFGFVLWWLGRFAVRSLDSVVGYWWCPAAGVELGAVVMLK